MLCRKVGHEVWYKLLIGVEERKEVVVGVGEIVGHDDEIILRGRLGVIIVLLHFKICNYT